MDVIKILLVKKNIFDFSDKNFKLSYIFSYLEFDSESKLIKSKSNRVSNDEDYKIINNNYVSSIPDLYVLNLCNYFFDYKMVHSNFCQNFDQLSLDFSNPYLLGAVELDTYYFLLIKAFVSSILSRADELANRHDLECPPRLIGGERDFQGVLL